ncbi:hypothetical protein [Culturomica massiliensis]|uniref:hypothetical protein n=2 Tax=Culturomica massiliensis TaxID=1841857 RepID=UPI000837AAAD|nr:hypothetical protein [Culturomica massiliensis]
MKSDSYCLSYVSICFNLRNNFLNLLSGVIQSGRRVATYTYASDEMKLSVVGADGRGYEYYGSLIYQINGSSLTFESAGFNEGRIYSGVPVIISKTTWAVSAWSWIRRDRSRNRTITILSECVRSGAITLCLPVTVLNTTARRSRQRAV